MPIELELGSAGITEENLIEIFKLFCKAYDIEYSEKDERWMRTQGMECLKSPFGIDYRPFLGAKFFGSVYGNERYAEFKGYKNSEDIEGEERRDRKFQELAIDYFTKKTSK